MEYIDTVVRRTSFKPYVKFKLHTFYGGVHVVHLCNDCYKEIERINNSDVAKVTVQSIVGELGITAEDEHYWLYNEGILVIINCSDPAFKAVYNPDEFSIQSPNCQKPPTEHVNLSEAEVVQALTSDGVIVRFLPRVNPQYDGWGLIGARGQLCLILDNSVIINVGS